MPELMPPRGSGSQRLYSERDVALARLLVDASAAGVPLRACARLVDVLRGDPAAWDQFLVIVGGAVIATVTPGAVLTDERTITAFVVSPAAAVAAVTVENGEDDDVRPVRV